MIDLKTHLESKVTDIISTWNEEDIYAISFFVHANESYAYNGYSNVTQFSISYNTEKDCKGADALSEKRWNYAFWRQNETPIIDTANENKEMKLLFEWYKENDIDNIGYEDFNASYDNEMRYIGKGPAGYYELLSEVTEVAKKIQDQGFLKAKFGKTIPIIIHDLEYSWYVIEATQKANTQGEADIFFAALKTWGIV